MIQRYDISYQNHHITMSQNGDYCFYEDVDKLEKDLAYFKNRDGQAGFQLMYDDGNNHFEVAEVTVADYGHSDNIYSLNCPLLESTLKELVEVMPYIEMWNQLKTTLKDFRSAYNTSQKPYYKWDEFLSIMGDVEELVLHESKETDCE